VPEPTQRPFYFALGGMALLVLAGIGFLIFNIIDHATHHESTSPVTVDVTSVVASQSNQVSVTATVSSAASSTVTVSCLVGIELPGEPLAYPTTPIIETIQPNGSVTVVVPKRLLKPVAQQVRVHDVAFTCS
jgi:hypothetical protein